MTSTLSKNLAKEHLERPSKSYLRLMESCMQLKGPKNPILGLRIENRSFRKWLKLCVLVSTHLIIVGTVLVWLLHGRRQAICIFRLSFAPKAILTITCLVNADRPSGRR
jgi:hypothetical protein